MQSEFGAGDTRVVVVLEMDKWLSPAPTAASLKATAQLAILMSGAAMETITAVEAVEPPEGANGRARVFAVTYRFPGVVPFDYDRGAAALMRTADRMVRTLCEKVVQDPALGLKRARVELVLPTAYTYER